MRVRPLVAVVSVVLTACGGGEGTPVTAPTTTPTPTETTMAASGIAVVDTTLGPILVDPEGWSLYGFTVDGPGVSNCDGGCAALWPPVPGDTPIGQGLDASHFSVIDRADGTTQLAVGDWPLYRYAGDARPGDLNGQGVEGVWFVVDEHGELVGAGSATEAPSGGSGDGPPPDPYNY